MFLKHFNKTAFLAVPILMLAFSCQENEQVLPSNEVVNQDEQAKLKSLESKLRHLALVMTDVLKESGTKELIQEGVNSNYYVDERILFEDLMNVEKSIALRDYAQKMPKSRTFKEAFIAVYAAKQYYKAKEHENYWGKSSIDLMDFLEQNPVSIYYPYHEKEANRALMARDDMSGVTISFNTVEEKDSNIGYFIDADQSVTEVVVDDNYARQNPTLILTVEGIERDEFVNPDYPGTGGSSGGGTGGGSTQPSIPLYPSPNQPAPQLEYEGEVNTDKCPTCPDVPSDKVHLIRLAEARVTTQLDPLFGLKNSGGSEVFFIRAESFLTNPFNPTIQAGGAAFPLKHFTRQAIDEERWEAHRIDLDTDWAVQQTQHVFGAIEFDNHTDVSVRGTVEFTIFSLDVELDIDFEARIGSKNQTLYQVDMNRTAYFVNSQTTNPSIYELRNGWAVYVGYGFEFTMPYFVSQW